MSNIYDDVETLKTQVATLETQIAPLVVQTLTEGADLKALSVGEYLIPNAEISATILNKPVTNTHTARVSVIPGGDEGQKSILFQTCNKVSPSFYHIAYYSSAWGNWNEIDLVDSGWIDLPLATGITAYSDAQKPRYRKVGKTIILNGVYRGAVGENVTIATLPTGYRPSKKVIVATASVGQMFSKLSIETSGEIILNRTTVEPIVSENWHSIACCFELN